MSNIADIDITNDSDDEDDGLDDALPSQSGTHSADKEEVAGPEKPVSIKEATERLRAVCIKLREIVDFRSRHKHLKTKALTEGTPFFPVGTAAAMLSTPASSSSSSVGIVKLSTTTEPIHIAIGADTKDYDSKPALEHAHSIVQRLREKAAVPQSKSVASAAASSANSAASAAAPSTNTATAALSTISSSPAADASSSSASIASSGSKRKRDPSRGTASHRPTEASSLSPTPALQQTAFSPMFPMHPSYGSGYMMPSMMPPFQHAPPGSYMGPSSAAPAGLGDVARKATADWIALRSTTSVKEMVAAERCIIAADCMVLLNTVYWKALPVDLQKAINDLSN